MKKIIIISIYLFLISANNAFAYLDPATGSIILQAILGAIAAGFSYCAFYWNKVKNFLRKLFNEKKSYKIFQYKNIFISKKINLNQSAKIAVNA